MYTVVSELHEVDIHTSMVIISHTSDYNKQLLDIIIIAMLL